jgi:hypothetical protein
MIYALEKIDYHSWGNIIITPFNCLRSNESEKKLENEFPQYYKMYQDFKKEAKNFQKISLLEMQIKQYNI